MSPPPLRPATEADVPRLAALAALTGASGWNEAALGAELQRPVARLCVLGAPGEVLGFSLAWLVGGRAELLTIAVEPALRRRGHGRRLLQDLVAEAARRGCDAVDLEVSAANAAAHALYLDLGFVEVARRAAYYADGSDALLMRRPVAL